MTVEKPEFNLKNMMTEYEQLARESQEKNRLLIQIFFFKRILKKQS